MQYIRYTWEAEKYASPMSKIIIDLSLLNKTCLTNEFLRNYEAINPRGYGKRGGCSNTGNTHPESKGGGLD